MSIPKLTLSEFNGKLEKKHGKRIKVDKCHPYDRNITAGELYNRTIKKEELFKSLGYDVISMWEMDFINKS